MNTHDIDIELPSSDEAAAHMLPSDLKKFEFGEHVAEAFSIAVGNPDETSRPLFTLDQVRAAIEADRKLQYRPVYEEGWKDALEWADRKRGGEPVAWIRKNGFRFNAEIEPQDDSEVPLYTAPQPAEPVMCEACRDSGIIGHSDI